MYAAIILLCMALPSGKTACVVSSPQPPTTLSACQRARKAVIRQAASHGEGVMVVCKEERP